MKEQLDAIQAGTLRNGEYDPRDQRLGRRNSGTDHPESTFSRVGGLLRTRMLRSWYLLLPVMQSRV